MTSDGTAEPLTRAARRARERAAGRSPASAGPVITRPRPLVAVAVVLAALALAAVGSLDHRAPEVVLYGVLGAVVALGWPRLTRSPTPLGVTAVLLVTTAGTTAALLLADPLGLEHVPVGLALGVVAMCLQPLAQPAARTDLVLSLAASGLGIGVLTCGAVLAAVPAAAGSPLVSAGVALAVAGACDLITERPRTHAWMLPVGVLAGGAGGLVAELAVDGWLGPWAGALVGMLAAGVALSLRRVLAQSSAVEDLPGALATGVASVLVTGPVVHLLARALLA